MASIQPLSNNSDNTNTKRRRFQAPITNFFTPASTSQPSSSNSNNSSSSSTTPALSHKIQSSLLTVGMRVRKSVPEGYKTKSFTLAETDAHTPTEPENETEEERETYAELTPYCGIMKTGNLAVQSFSRVHMAAASRPRQVFDREGVVFSTGSGVEDVEVGSTRKRVYEGEEVDDEEETGFPSSQSSVPDLTPSSSQESTSTTASSRQILLPRLGVQRRVPRVVVGGMVKGGEGQENRVTVVEDDFDEASFLQRREDVEMDDE